MQQPYIEYETPESVVLRYKVAGPGSRFLAFFIDSVLIFVGLVTLLLFGLIFLQLFGPNSAFGQSIAGIDPAAAVAVFIIISSFAYIGYFIAFEMAMSGQTPGKRMVNCRVVRERGFSLTPAALLIRGIFRVVDSIPVLWIVPILSPKLQRFGDMAAGTIVILEEPAHASPMRELLAARDPQDAVFPVSGADASRLLPVDVHGMEEFCEVRAAMHPEHRERILQAMVNVLTQRIGYNQPVETNLRERFIEELLAAHYRREAQEAL